MVNTLSQMISAWNVDIYFGWSIMDVFALLLVLWFAATVINYFFFKASS